MSLVELMIVLVQLGIRLETRGDKLRYSPQSAVPPELKARLKANKTELLSVLRHGINRSKHVDQTGDEFCCEPVAQPPLDRLDVDGWTADSVDPDELTPCPKCGSLELWETVAFDLFGLPPGKWRCLRCDPPAAARRLCDRATLIHQTTRYTNGKH